MSYNSGFFDAMDLGGGQYDREYVAAQFAHYFSLFVGNGVFANPSTTLGVLAANVPSMYVNIQAGSGFIKGYYITVAEHTMEEIQIPLASPTLPRIDSVILGLDLEGRVITPYLRSGDPATNPAPVALQRDDTVLEIELAQIYVGAGVGVINQIDITDMRPHPSRCGFVTGLVDQFDVSGFFAAQEAAFYEWLDNLETELSGDVAGNLQVQINALQLSSAVKERLGLESGFTLPNDAFMKIPLTQKGAAYFNRCKVCVGNYDYADVDADLQLLEIMATPDKTKYVGRGYSDRNMLYLLDADGEIIVSMDVGIGIGSIVTVDNDTVIIQANNTRAYRFDSMGFTPGATASLGRTPRAFYSHVHENDCLLIGHWANNTNFVHKYDKQADAFAQAASVGAPSAVQPTGWTTCPGGLIFFKTTSSGSSGSSAAWFYSVELNTLTVLSSQVGSFTSYAACSAEDGFFLLRMGPGTQYAVPRTLFKYVIVDGVATLDYQVTLGNVGDMVRPNSIWLDGDYLQLGAGERYDINTQELHQLARDEIVSTFLLEINRLNYNRGTNNNIYFSVVGHGIVDNTSAGTEAYMTKPVAKTASFEMFRYGVNLADFAVLVPRLCYLTYLEEGVS